MWESKKSVTQVTKGSVEEPFYADFINLDLQDCILEVFPEYASAEVVSDPEEDDCGCGTGCGCGCAPGGGPINVLQPIGAVAVAPSENIKQTRDATRHLPQWQGQQLVSSSLQYLH